MKKQVLLMLLLLTGAVQASSPLSELSVTPEVSRSDAPDFSLENLRGVNSSLADFRGKVVLLNFWATWCMPCRDEMPGMETLWQRYKDEGFVVVAVSIDEGSKKRIETFTRLFELSFPVLLDPESEVNDLYKVSNMPTSFLIDRDGKIIARIVGSDNWLSEEAVQLVEKVLSE